MSDITIQVENLSKHYRITRSRRRHDTLRDQISDALAALLTPGSRRSGYETIVALDNVSFTVRDGEILGLIGRNGAGKSTLLKILSRITEPTRGRAVLHGRVGSLLEVGTGFHPELSGRENIYLNGAILGMHKAEIDRKLDEIIAFSEIETFIDTPVKQYSSGMYVRLAFAVAAHLQPEILLLDEVLAVGDLRFQQKCLEHAKRLQAEAATVLFVSHNMFAVKAMCSRVLFIAGGRVCADGPPEEIIPLYEADNRLAPVRGMHRGGDMNLFTSIEVLDAAGRPRQVFEHGEQICVRLGYEVPERIRDANVVVAFVRSDSVNACNYCTATDGFPLPVLSGSGVLEVLTPPVKLVSESYTIHALIWDSKFEHLHSAQYGATFHVRHPLFSTHFGVYHEPARWSWTPEPAPPAAGARAEVNAAVPRP